MIRKNINVVLIISMIMLLTSSCALFSNTVAEPEEKDETTKITLTPIDLFEGDAAKFKPFLGFMSGAFKLQYEGNKPAIHLNIELWKNGEKVTTYGSIVDLFYNSEAGLDTEVIISIDTVSVEGHEKYGKINVGTIHDKGSSTNSFTIPWDETLRVYGLMQYVEPQTFDADEPVHVWGVQATSTNALGTADFSEESLGRLEWAIILTLSDEWRTSTEEK